jgi:hypothetical protein
LFKDFFFIIFFMSFAFFVWIEKTWQQIAFGDSPRSLKKDYGSASVDRRWLSLLNPCRTHARTCTRTHARTHARLALIDHRWLVLMRFADLFHRKSKTLFPVTRLLASVGSDIGEKVSHR